MMRGEFVRELIHCNNGKGMQDDELQSCFGYELYSQVFKHLSYQEARDKYYSWKKQKEEEATMKEVTALAEKIGIHKLYSMVKEIRGE